MKWLYKNFPIIYILALVILSFSIYSILKTENLPVKNVEKKEKEIVEVKPVNITLIIEGVGSNKVFNRNLTNRDTFDDLLEELRDDGLIYYEKADFTYGSEYINVNRYISSDDQIWKVYAGGEDVTFNTKGMYLNDGWIYRLVLSNR